MPDQHLIWTVLPNGIQNNMLRASIFITPRLYDGETLGAFFPSFPEFQNWPAVVKQAGLFSLRVGDVTQQATLISQPDEGYWTSLFNANTPVIPYVREDYGSRTIKSYPVTQIVQALKDQADHLTLTSRAFHSDKLGVAEKYIAIRPLNGQDGLVPIDSHKPSQEECQECNVFTTKENCNDRSYCRWRNNRNECRFREE